MCFQPTALGRRRAKVRTSRASPLPSDRDWIGRWATADASSQVSRESLVWHIRMTAESREIRPRPSCVVGTRVGSPVDAQNGREGYNVIPTLRGERAGHGRGCRQGRDYGKVRITTLITTSGLELAKPDRDLLRHTQPEAHQELELPERRGSRGSEKALRRPVQPSVRAPVQKKHGEACSVTANAALFPKGSTRRRFTPTSATSWQPIRLQESATSEARRQEASGPRTLSM